jgi:hypothetical protein
VPEAEQTVARRNVSTAVSRFREEVRRARLLLYLYAEIATRDIAAIKARVDDPKAMIDKQLREAIQAEEESKAQDYQDLQHILQGVVRDRELVPYLSLSVLLEDGVAPYIEDVTIRPQIEPSLHVSSEEITHGSGYQHIIAN